MYKWSLVECTRINDREYHDDPFNILPNRSPYIMLQFRFLYFFCHSLGMSGWSLAECRMINDLENDDFMSKFGPLHRDSWVFTNPKK